MVCVEPEECDRVFIKPFMVLALQFTVHCKSVAEDKCYHRISSTRHCCRTTKRSLFTRVLTMHNKIFL